MSGFNINQLQELITQARSQASDLQKKMQTTVVEASAGGGSVSVKMNGQKQVLAVTIDPEMIKSGDVEMLQDLVTAAVNEAGRKADEMMKSSLGGLITGLGLPGV